jgi:histidinol-phosphate aminotransferase
MKSKAETLKIRSAILRMAPYLPPMESRDPEKHLLMDFNESPMPPSLGAIKAIADFLSKRANVYPAYHDFLKILSIYTGIEEDQLILSNGSDHGIELVLRCFLEPGDKLLMALPGFSMFEQVALTLGAKVRGPKYSENMAFPAQALHKAVDDKTRLMVLINPNNPTGTIIKMDVIRSFLKNFPDLPILVDEAYFEFSGQTAAELLQECSNLIILRTFSKALALSSLRLGYIMANSELIQQFAKIRGPFDINSAAIIGAKYQLEHPQDWKPLVRHLMDEVKPALESFFKINKVHYHPSSANFMLVKMKNAKDVVKFLKSKDILVRQMRPPIDNTFRMSLRKMPEMKHFMNIFQKYLEKKDY